MELRSLRVTRTARFAVLGEPGPGITEVWYLLHGYGQLATAFAEGFALLAAPHRLLVAPEALSRFYTRGLSGQPGASWMTREDRDNEIVDTVAYLDAVQESVAGELGGAPDRSVVLGFSQGCAAASRWIALGDARPDALVCWSGAPAHDIELATLIGTRLLIIRGDADPLLPADAINRERERLRAAGLSPEEIVFSGGHEVRPEVVHDVAARLRA